MIPVSLKLKNFLSYGEDVPPLDFQEFHVVCLSGQNGHGKSALLDAITWALWGEARKAPGDRKPDDNLLRIGATEMQVEFEFDLEGDRFRILRQYRRTGRGTTKLEFQIFDPQQDAYQPLTQPTIRGTQDKINQFLRMDYTTFVNSAFLLQGRADEFSRQSARKRKEILADILGLSRYDELGELARIRAREAAQKAQGCEDRLNQIEEELKPQEDYRKRLEEIEATLDELSMTITRAEAHLAELRERRSELLSQKRRATDWEQTLRQLDRDLAELEAQSTQQKEEIAACEKILAQRPQIETAVRRWTELREQDRELNEKRGLVEEYNERIHALERTIEAARHELENQHQVEQTRWQHARERIQEVEEVLSRGDDIEKGVAVLHQARAAEERWERLRQEVETLSQQERDLQRRIEQARAEVEVKLRTLTHRAQELQQRAASAAQSKQQLEQAQAALRQSEQDLQLRENLREQERELATHIQTLKNHRDRFQEEVRGIQEKQAFLERSPSARCPLCDSHLGAQGLQAVRQRYEETIREHRRQIESIHEQGRKLVKQRKEIRARMQPLEEIPARVTAVQRQIAALETALREANQAQAEIEAVQQQANILQQQLDTQAYAPEMVRQWQEIQARVQALGYDPQQHAQARRQARESQPYEAEYQRLQEARSRYEQMQQALPEIETRARQLAQQLEQGQYAREEQAERARLIQKRKAVAYHPEVHRRVQEELQQLQDTPRQQERLEEAERRLAAARERQERIAATLADRRQRHQEVTAERAHLLEAVAGWADLEREIATQEPRLRQAQQQREALLLERGSLQSKYQRGQELEEERGELRTQLQQARRDADLYTKLATAFGKDGIQALIIENAIPEIEEEANHLLRRLTHNRTQITIEPLRDLKSGGTKETLDLHISDELGTRNYDLFSVDGTEPTYIRQDGFIRSLSLEELWDSNRETESVNGYEMQPGNHETLCYVDGAAAWQPVSAILRHPAPDKMLKVSCVPGNYSITITPNHSIFVMTVQGLVVKRGDELQPGDFVLTPRCIPEHRLQKQVDLLDHIEDSFIERRAEVGKSLQWDDEFIWSRRDQTQKRFVKNEEQWAEFLGIMVAEASGRKALSVAVGDNESMAQRIVEMASHLLGMKCKSLTEIPADTIARYTVKHPGVSSETPRKQYRPCIGGRLLAHIIGNIIGHGARNKRVPPCIFNASPEAQKSFLHGLIAGDGHLRIRPAKSQTEVGLTTISPGLVADVLFLCRQLGIWARVEKHGEAGFERGMKVQESYRVAISGQENVSRLFGEVDVVRYTSRTRYEGIPLALLNIRRNTGHLRLRRGVLDDRFPCGSRMVPSRSREQYQSMSHLLRDWNVLEVRKVEEVPPTSDYVYDLAVPGNHSFVAGTGAILVHNSGGERFRVDFALRLALSKLLAQRAGTRLRTLVIDEGFGTQDAEGLEQFVEAIQEISKDFAKVLVVTHLETLKNAFPTRIEVVKEPERGSRFEIIG